MRTVKIKGSVKDYAWGNDYYIANLLSLKREGSKAEYWMGAHPSGDAITESEEKLSSYIASDPVSALGSKRDKLPLLFKILAIEKPLSLQCHPNKKQAEEGWKREEPLRASGKEYNYQDDNEKAEIIYALSPISAMCGFREKDEIDANFRKYIPSSYKKYFNSQVNDIEKMFFTLYELKDAEKKEVLKELEESLNNDPSPSYDGEFLNLKAIALECLKEYEGDIGALAPLFMNVVHLNVGEALFLKPDTLHAYVYGNGVELMSSSDNVLRGGLTKKRVDLEELKRIMEFTSLDVEKVKKINDEKGREIMLTDTPSFRLAKMDSGTYRVHNEAGIVIVIDGSLTIKEKESVLKLEKGEVAFIAYSADAELSLSGLAFEAIVPPLS